ncbi:MAG: 30S ribosomal protein S4 [Deltaproteobacteria bacterium]|nr:30S ribosomal protein S4 [Deltaproteobacteria bacterium]
MSRYTGPRLKKMRALGLDLPGLSRKSIERRPYPPGQHGPKARRKLSDFGKQLIEKQKLRLNYGLGERQMRRYMIEARRSKTASGDKLVELLERRLDNVVFRAGFAPTIPAARQLVAHGHLTVNGRSVDVPSFQVKAGDTVAIRARKKGELKVVAESLEGQSISRPDWLDVSREQKIAKIRDLPTRESVPFQVDLQQVVEYYAKRL